LGASPAATAAQSNDCLVDGRHLTVRGTIVETAFTDYRQDEPFRHFFIAIAFDRPRCDISEFSGTNSPKVDGIMLMAVEDLQRSWIGHHVASEAAVSDNGGTIHSPTIVNLNPISIRDIKP
jgi:hypothetical protein